MKQTDKPLKECIVLLDDCTANGADPRSRLYTGCIGSLHCARDTELPAMLEELARALQHHHAVGLFSYELGAELHHVAHGPSPWPLAQILLFERCEHLDAASVERWLAAQERTDATAQDGPTGVANVHANVDEPTFSEALRKIRTYIEAGDTYQVNYTYRLRADIFGSPITLYRRLRARQPVPYGALMLLPDGRSVLSLSPELFVRHENRQLTARPMKGTALASGDAAFDAQRARVLSEDEKNCAENLMIVDLLRNDLGRIAQWGSVNVPTLFEVSAFGDVLQMTSTITAQLHDATTLAEVFQAVYPCGSITGAPKKRAMEIIHEIEPAARGLYTGAIGWFDKSNDADRLPNFCLSVPIRTLVLEAPDEAGVRQGEFGVGAGIVFDSQIEEEYAECQLKARFLSTLPQTFALFETMRAMREGCPLLDRHLQRLRHSARYFGFPVDEASWRATVLQVCSSLEEGPHRLRLTVASDGVSVQCAPLSQLTEPVRVLLSNEPMPSNNLFLKHKTTVRLRYDEAWRAAEKHGAFDMLFFNERGELTEGGRSNVFVKVDDQWLTPPLSSGVLPGVMRSVLLEDPAWHARERVLTREDLDKAESVIVCNALRGVLKAEVVKGEW